MTEKEMNKLADLVADRVIKKLEIKQAEWDQEVIMEVQNMTTDPALLNFSYPPQESPKDLLDKQLTTLKNALKKALEEEDFERCKIIDEKIIKVNKKLLDL